MKTRKISIVIAVLVILSLALTGVGMAAEGDVQVAADTYFSGGTQNIKAADLFEILSDGDDSNDPFIIDARKAEDFELGHIPGAVNIGAKAAFTPEKLETIPTDQPVVVYCYTGQTSSQMASALNMLGYEAKSMLYGFPTWANVAGVSVPPFDREVDGHDYMFTDEAVEATEEFDAAAPLGDTVAEAAEAYFSNGTKNIKASALFENLSDGDDSNDPFLVDVRRPEDYEAGHIPGAINMSAKTMFTAENLAKLPADQPIVVNCYSGQTASQVTSALNALGYDATNLKFGFASWSPTGKYSFVAADSPNYRYEGTGEIAEVEAEEAEMAAILPVASEAEAGAFTWSVLVYDLGMVNQVSAAAAMEDGTIIRVTITSPNADAAALEEAILPMLEAYGAQ